MMRIACGLLALGLLTLSGCDVVRYPGDGREPAPQIPPGAPGPPPPTLPVDDPWGEGESETPVDNETDAPPETPQAPDDADQEANPETEPVTQEPGDVTDAGSELDSETPVVVPVEDPVIPLPVKFEYFASGDLIPDTGLGRPDETLYAPQMLFPIRTAPAYPQSMVYRPGGGVGGDQCDASNYAAPWRDNFCERRGKERNTPLCPTNKVHQGQDIRTGTAADCEAMRRQSKAERGLHEAVAVEDGIIQHIGTYSVQLKGLETGNLYSYLHLNMARLAVEPLQTVAEGDLIGFVSNDFGTVPTTFHLHFEMKAAVEGVGFTHVPPYASLRAAYERREEGVGELVVDDTVAVASRADWPENILDWDE